MLLSGYELICPAKLSEQLSLCDHDSVDQCRLIRHQCNVKGIMQAFNTSQSPAMRATTDNTEAMNENGYAAKEWVRLYADIPRVLRDRIFHCVEKNGEALADAFYKHMMADPMAQRFLDHEMVSTRLRHSMQLWLVELFRSEDERSVQAAIAHQRHVGEVHARIHLPPQLMTRGARLLRKNLGTLIGKEDIDRDALILAQHFIAELIDLAMELMNTAYSKSAARHARSEEAYRHHALGQNISLERERQRAALLEWGQQVLFMLHLSHGDYHLPCIRRSEFGMWINHKARVMFEGAPELEDIAVLIERLDDTLLPQLSKYQAGALEHQRQLSRELQGEIDEIRYLLSAMFDRFGEVENGRDVLTRLLNRRFLPAVLGREIALHQKSGNEFGVLLIDIDHFKNINDCYGHEGGDQVLQQAAQLIGNSVRSGDFVFRYGGEEILVVVVEANAKQQAAIAEALRQAFASTSFMVGNGKQTQVTVSIGTAGYDGHPDFQYLISRADEAMYRAKHRGRNRVEFAE
ncbi:diguanylate cyclase [Aquitalea sp. S1-19]|nr:diguanylate cyclase [Aquitalea sp. S1-19]